MQGRTVGGKCAHPLMMTTMDPNSSLKPKLTPSWPGCAPRQRVQGGVLCFLCFGSAGLHTCLPNCSGPPVYPENTQVLHTII